MMILLYIVTIVLSGLYLFALLKPVLRFSRLPESKESILPTRKISVIVPARNEERNLQDCLVALVKQEVQAEIIVVNDHSEDKTSDIVAMFPEVKLVHLPLGEDGKKAALRAGIAVASGEIIMVTDADCIPPIHWTKTVASAIHDNVLLAFGPVMMTGAPGILTALQQVESIAVQSVSAGLLSGGVAFTASGANMAYERNLPSRTGGYLYSGTPSGDDVFLLLQTHSQAPDSVKWVHNLSATVPAAAANDFGQYVSQRVRWASKYKHYKDKQVQLIGAVVVASIVLLWGLLIGALFFKWLQPIFILNLLLKFAADFLLLSLAVTFFQKRSLLRWFILVWPIYQLCIPLITIGAFTGRFRWKNRSYKTRTSQR